MKKALISKDTARALWWVVGWDRAWMDCVFDDTLEKHKGKNARAIARLIATVERTPPEAI